MHVRSHHKKKAKKSESRNFLQGGACEVSGFSFVSGVLRVSGSANSESTFEHSARPDAAFGQSEFASAKSDTAERDQSFDDAVSSVGGVAHGNADTIAYANAITNTIANAEAFSLANAKAFALTDAARRLVTQGVGTRDCNAGEPACCLRSIGKKEIFA
jgi:hypothetical protein